MTQSITHLYNVMDNLIIIAPTIWLIWHWYIMHVPFEINARIKVDVRRPAFTHVLHSIILHAKNIAESRFSVCQFAGSRLNWKAKSISSFVLYYMMKWMKTSMSLATIYPGCLYQFFFQSQYSADYYLRVITFCSIYRIFICPHNAFDLLIHYYYN